MTSYITNKKKSSNKVRINNKFKLGVTLVELLIVVGIITIVSLAIIPSYLDFAEKKDFNNKVETVVSEVMNVRNKALAGAVYITGSGTTEEVNWGIVPRQNCDLRVYDLGYVYPDDDTLHIVSSQTLPDSVSFARDSGGQCDLIIFERLKGTPILDTANGETFMEINLRYKSMSRRIIVNSSGRVSYN